MLIAVLVLIPIGTALSGAFAVTDYINLVFIIHLSARLVVKVAYRLNGTPTPRRFFVRCGESRFVFSVFFRCRFLRTELVGRVCCLDGQCQ